MRNLLPITIFHIAIHYIGQLGIMLRCNGHLTPKVLSWLRTRFQVHLKGRAVNRWSRLRLMSLASKPFIKYIMSADPCDKHGRKELSGDTKFRPLPGCVKIFLKIPCSHVRFKYQANPDVAAVSVWTKNNGILIILLASDDYAMHDIQYTQPRAPH